MGRSSVKVYEYNNKGKFIQEHLSIAEFANKHNVASVIFSNESRIFNNIYDCTNGNIASIDKIGRIGVLKYLEYRNNRFVGKNKRISEAVLSNNFKGKVIFYDLDMVKIAEFKSVFQARLLTGWSESCFIVPFGELKKNRNGIYIEVLKTQD